MSNPNDQVLLSVRGLHKNFGGLKVTQDVTLDMRAGIVTTLVGPNGAGKTTLFNLITGYLRPTAGDILWCGKSIVGQPHWKIAREGISRDRKSTRLNSSHPSISYAVFCLKKK